MKEPSNEQDMNMITYHSRPLGRLLMVALCETSHEFETHHVLARSLASLVQPTAPTPPGGVALRLGHLPRRQPNSHQIYRNTLYHCHRKGGNDDPIVYQQWVQWLAYHTLVYRQ